MTKLEKWQKTLKPGDSVRLLFNQMEVLGIFLQWKDYDTYYRTGKGAEFVSISYGRIGWCGKPEQLIEACKNKDFSTYRERIISYAETRVRPVQYEMLEDYEKECLTILKNKLDEYQNN